MTAQRSTVRSRRRATSTGLQMSADEAMRAAGKDQDAWDAIRPHVVRQLAAKVKNAQDAASIFEAYRKRPELLPMRAPHQQPNNT